MILKFVNRDEEVAILEKAYRGRKAEFFIIFGRRRVGKTELVKHFIENKTGFYFLAKEQSLEIEFERFKEKLSKNFDIYLEGKDWETLLIQALEKIGQRMVIVIDEFPYWISKDRSILSEFQHLWDEHLSDKNVVLILMGSSVGMMEDDVLGHKSPLYGRRTGQMQVQPLRITEMKEFFPGYATKDLIRTYGCLDTMPYYLNQFDPEVDIWENMRNTFLNPAHPLYQDAEILLSSELREPNVYFNIIRATLEGATKLGEIANSARVDITNMPKYLNTLVNLRVLRKTRPLTSPKEKRALYELTDNYFTFWLTYVYPYQEEIAVAPERHLEFIKDTYSGYMGPMFESFCKEALRAIRPIQFNNIGRWWYKEQEIDIIATDDKTKDILFCECKWQDKVNPKKIYEELKAKAEVVQWGPKGRKEKFAIFARSFNKRIEEDGLTLHDLDGLGGALFDGKGAGRT